MAAKLEIAAEFAMQVQHHGRFGVVGADDVGRGSVIMLAVAMVDVWHGTSIARSFLARISTRYCLQQQQVAGLDEAAFIRAWIIRT